jgi:hypothetical protein
VSQVKTPEYCSGPNNGCGTTGIFNIGSSNCFGQDVETPYNGGYCDCKTGEFTLEEKYLMSGTLSGLQYGGGGLQLVTASIVTEAQRYVQSSMSLRLNKNGAFEFPFKLFEGQKFQVSAKHDPWHQACTIAVDGGKPEKMGSGHAHAHVTLAIKCKKSYSHLEFRTPAEIAEARAEARVFQTAPDCLTASQATMASKAKAKSLVVTTALPCKHAYTLDVIEHNERTDLQYATVIQGHASIKLSVDTDLAVTACFLPLGRWQELGQV